jgi:hypothetical protein
VLRRSGEDVQESDGVLTSVPFATAVMEPPPSRNENQRKPEDK